MSTSRLSTALSEGLTVEGPVHVLSAPAGYDLSALRDVRVETSFFPDHAYWEAAGLAGEGDDRVATLVVLPRSKTLARVLVVEAIQAGGTVIVDGQKTDGVESLYKDLRKLVAIEGVVTKAHGRLFWFTAGPVPDWPLTVASPDGFETVPGVFSEAKIDAGSALLAPYLEGLSAKVADFGAGWGFLSRAILRNEGVTHLDMVEAERRALDCAVVNVEDSRAQAIWTDIRTFDRGGYDAIVSNPPFHTSRAGDPDLGRAFIEAAARNLTPRGVFWMVANRHLPYEPTLATYFALVEERPGSGGFKIFRASRPQRRN